jgi:hypothetical protein
MIRWLWRVIVGRPYRLFIVHRPGDWSEKETQDAANKIGQWLRQGGPLVVPPGVWLEEVTNGVPVPRPTVGPRGGSGIAPRPCGPGQLKG